jgi:hypothetical protein
MRRRLWPASLRRELCTRKPVLGRELKGRKENLAARGGEKMLVQVTARNCESWRVFPPKKKSSKPLIRKVFLKVLVELLTPIPLWKFGLSFPFLSATKCTILRVGGLVLTSIFFAYVFGKLAE